MSRFSSFPFSSDKFERRMKWKKKRGLFHRSKAAKKNQPRTHFRYEDDSGL